MTYDASDGYLLFFGAGKTAGQTWTFSNGTWTELFPASSPKAQSFACLTYDWNDRYVVFFGGGSGGIGQLKKTNSQTWTFHAGDWTELHVNSPPGLRFPSCTYDSADGYLLLFGGVTANAKTYTGTSGPTLVTSNQTWKFSGGVWTNLTSYRSPHPSARFGASMAYDSADGYVILFGGALNGTSTANGSCSAVQCPHYNQTWKFVDGTWTNITAGASVAGTPPGRWETSMTNDTADGYDIIFGGQANGYKSLNATGNYNWKFVEGKWTNISADSPRSPGTRFGAAMGYDSETGATVLYSGLAGTVNTPLRDDTWSFQEGVWECLWYAANFTETGLPTNASWKVTLAPTSGSPRTMDSTSGTMIFIEPNGSYGYSISPIAGYRIANGPSTGLVTAIQPNVAVSWTQVTYAVKFAETGLPSGTSWSASFNGHTKSSIGRSITFSEPNGSYGYSISAIPGYHITTGSYEGSVTVSGANPAVTHVHWTQVTYVVKFTETGLPRGTSWSVTIDGKTDRLPHTSSSITFHVPNGTFSFAVSATGFIETSNPPSPLRVEGADVSVEVTFT